jgi:hypothetical protein
MRARTGSLTFDPSALLSDSASADTRAFVRWFEPRMGHQEFPDVAGRLAAIQQSHCDRFDFEMSFFLSAYRAATLPLEDPQQPWETLLVEDILTTAAAGSGPLRSWSATLKERVAGGGNINLRYAQHGPVLFLNGIAGRRRLPTPATLFAAQTAFVFRTMQIPGAWTLLTKTCAVAGLGEEIAPESLRVRAGRVLKEVESGRALLLGWPQDIGCDLKSLLHAMATVQLRR